MAIIDHVVSIVIGGQQVDGWISYEIDSSMTEPSDSFVLVRPFDRDAWNLCRLDSRVRVTIDDTVMIDGFIDTRETDAEGGTMQITGRDKAGRLVQESVPQVVFAGLKLTQIAEKIVSPWFSKVVLSDARNRLVRRGKKGSKAPTGNEPIVLDTAQSTRLDPGQMRWAALEEIVGRAGYIMWSSADGSEFIIGKPNYNQAPQVVIAHPEPGSSRRATCKSLRITESIADMYSRIIAVGSGGTVEDFGPNAASRVGDARNNPDNVDGVGRDFTRAKRLILPEQAIRSADEAKRYAAQEMRRRSFGRLSISATMPGHGQVLTGSAPTLFAPNTMAQVIHEELGFSQPCLIYSCKYRVDRKAGYVTDLMLVPSGTEFAP